MKNIASSIWRGVTLDYLKVLSESMQRKCPETMRIIMVPLYPSAMSFAGKKRNDSNIGANLNSKIVIAFLVCN